MQALAQATQGIMMGSRQKQGGLVVSAGQQDQTDTKFSELGQQACWK